MSERLEKQHFQYADWSKGLFSELVSVKGPGRLLFLSGIGAEDAGARPGVIHHPGDVYRQTRLAYEKAAALLARHDATLADVVKISAYLLDAREAQNYHRARTEAFAGVAGLPAHTFLFINSLAWPGMLVEVDLTAAVPSADRGLGRGGLTPP
jgi:enamine deaminase RidA (YjgF/YER057c/UK114 family)